MKAQELVASLYRQDFPSFIPFAFRQVHPGVDYMDNWHIDVVADALAKVWRGEESRLIINLPPRSLKSFCVSVAFVAWILAKAPDKEILHICGNRDLKNDLEASCRTLLLHPKMRAVFPHLRLIKTSKHIVLAQGGARRAAMAYENLTGRGADMILLDDPMDAGKADDPKEIERLAKWVQSTVVQRLNRPDGPIILVMQRLNANDLIQQLAQSGEKWTILSIPAIATTDEKHVLSDGTVFTRSRFEPLHPARQSSDDLHRITQTIGAKSFRAQYQQRPLEIGAGKSNSASVFIPPNKNPDRPCGFYRVTELDRLMAEVFGDDDKWFSVPERHLYDMDEWEAMAIAQQAELVASMRGDFL